MESTFTSLEQAATRTLIELALEEDLRGGCDLTSIALVPAEQNGTVQIVARQPGVVSGLPIIEQVFWEIDAEVQVDLLLRDGESVSPGRVLASLEGPVRSLLTGERTVLNFLTALGGVATLTRRFVDATEGTRAGFWILVRPGPAGEPCRNTPSVVGAGPTIGSGFMTEC